MLAGAGAHGSRTAIADRHLLVDLVALGGMGSSGAAVTCVWTGPVAVKLMAGDALIDPTTVEPFDREARTMARLNRIISAPGRSSSAAKTRTPS